MLVSVMLTKMQVDLHLTLLGQPGRSVEEQDETYRKLVEFLEKYGSLVEYTKSPVPYVRWHHS